MDGHRRIMLMVAIVASTVLGGFGWRGGCLELPRGGKGWRRNCPPGQARTTGWPPARPVVQPTRRLFSGPPALIPGSSPPSRRVMAVSGGHRSDDTRTAGHRQADQPYPRASQRLTTKSRRRDAATRNALLPLSENDLCSNALKGAEIHPPAGADPDDNHTMHVALTDEVRRDRVGTVGVHTASRPRPAVESSARDPRPGARIEGEREREGADKRDDERFMRMALRLAQQAGEEGEVPVGAVLAESEAGTDGRRRMLATGRNNVERRRDATAHAEMLCLQAASMARRNWRLSGATLYVTMEPCVMCLSAAQLSRVDRVVYGAPSPNLGACGGWVDLPTRKHAFHALEVRGRVLEDECARPLREFFRSRRHPKASSLDRRGAVAGND